MSIKSENLGILFILLYERTRKWILKSLIQQKFHESRFQVTNNETDELNIDKNMAIIITIVLLYVHPKFFKQAMFFF